MRISASRPRNADASRLVTRACSGASGSPLGGGTCSSAPRTAGPGWCRRGSGRRRAAWCWPPRRARTRTASAGPARARRPAAASSSRSDATSSSRSWLASTTSAMRASGRSVLLTTRITGRCAASALRSTNRVCGSGPSDASTSSNTPSTIDSPRSTSPPKSAWPGVSMTLITVTVPSGSWRCTAVFLARMVMPFSRSRSPVSITRSCRSPRSCSAPDCRSIASTSVVLPWSTWATMATLRNGTSVIVAARGLRWRTERPIDIQSAPRAAVLGRIVTVGAGSAP